MITQRQYIKSESPMALGAAHYCSLGRRSSTSSSSMAGPGGEMPMKLEERLNELESNAVKALLSLGEAFVNQTPYRNPPKRQQDAFLYARPLQPQQQQQQNHQTRSVIVKAEPVVHDDRVTSSSGQQRSPLNCTSGQNFSVRELPTSNNGLTFNNHATIKFTSAPGCSSMMPQNSSSNMTGSPVSIQPVVSAVSSSSPMISTIFYQIPATAYGNTNGTTTGTAVTSPSFTFIPAPNGPRTVIPLPMVTANAAPLVKIEPGTTQSATMNWNNIQLVKVPRNSIDNNGMTTFSTLAPATTLPKPTLLPSPGKGDGKSLLAAAVDGKSPTKSRARRRSQSTTKGQSRGSRVLSGSSDIVVSSSVEGLPGIVVDGYEIQREIWAKAFLQNDIIHAAGTLFNALFSSEEIKNCTLNGRNGTRQLCPEKRHAIFKIVAWMRNKCQDPYSFNRSPEDTKILNREEQMMIEKKVFVERRYQTSRKIRDLPTTSPTAAPSVVPSTTPAANATPKKCATPERRDSGSFSSIRSNDDKGIPKIALIQSSEIIANYFQSAEPLPVSVSTPTSLHNHEIGPPPMKMQKVG